MKRHATAVWQGTGKEGKGHLSTQSTTLDKTQYSFSSRFEEGVGTNPEELVAAAHAGCFNGCTLRTARSGPSGVRPDGRHPLEKGDFHARSDTVPPRTDGRLRRACAVRGSGAGGFRLLPEAGRHQGLEHR